MQIAIASGKGGTGKTFLATCLVRYLKDRHPVVIDADVEEPNTGLHLPHEVVARFPVHRPVPSVDYDHCTFCGKCAEICRFNALVVSREVVLVYKELCHSCGACSFLCPERAIKEEPHLIGTIEEARLKTPEPGKLFTGRLIIGEAQSPPLIKAVKARGTKAPIRIVDCPPGTTCPMIEAIHGADYCILITEPTPFGLHDLELSLEACQMLDVPAGLVINRYQGDPGEIHSLAEKFKVPILGLIPFSMALARSYARGEDPMQVLPELEEITARIFTQVKEYVT